MLALQCKRTRLCTEHCIHFYPFIYFFLQNFMNYVKIHLSVTTIKPPPTAILSIASLHMSYRQSKVMQFGSRTKFCVFFSCFSARIFDHLLWMRRSSAPEARSQNLSTCFVQGIKFNCTFLSVCSFWKWFVTLGSHPRLQLDQCLLKEDAFQ